MGGWGELLAAFAAFLLSHALPARPALRRRLAGVLGERGYLLAYSLVSLGVLAWLVAAAGRAPHVELWPPAPWQAWVPNLLMPAACLLVAFAVGAPNPLSFGGRATGFDPDRPGIAGVARHPLLLAIALWAGAHAVPNGNLAHVLLFGAFAGFALLGMRIIDRRRRRQMGEAAWAALAARSSAWPLAALLDGRWRASALPSPVRLGAGLLLWLALLAAHPAAIGVSPLPP
jgi:uncharacterized membrane protein